MYKIKISKLRFTAIIGILDYERINTQKIEVNFECVYSDKNKYINYMDIASLIQSSITNNKYQLIEDAIDDICINLRNKYSNMKDVFLEIIKLDVLENGYVSITTA